MAYPGNSRELEATDVAETVKEAIPGNEKPPFGAGVVPGNSGLLEVTVCSGITDMVFVSGTAGRLPVPSAPAADDVNVTGRVDGACDKRKMLTDGVKEKAVSRGELEDTAGLLGGATHLVQRMDVEVRVTVEMVVMVSSNEVLPEVTRLVTGQVVNVV